MADRDVHLPNLARELHSTRQLTPMQIRNRTGFLDVNERPYIVGYRHPTAAFAGEVDSLLDEASYGSRWVALAPRRESAGPGTALPSES